MKLSTELSPELHRRLKIEAATAGDTINRIVQKAVERELTRRQELRTAGLSR